MRFFFFLIIMLSRGTTALDCELHISPATAVVRFGDPLVASCNSSSCSNIEGMGWEASSGETGLVSGVTELLFKINETKEWDIRPKCYISFTDRDQKIVELKVIVYKIPDTITIPTPIPLEEHQSRDILCEIVDIAPAEHLVVFWYMEDEVVLEEEVRRDQKTPVNHTSVFSFTPHRGHNGKKIFCEVKVNLFPRDPDILVMQSSRRTLTVYYPPTFAEPGNEEVEFFSHSKILLNCTATGNPSPVYSWTFPHNAQKEIKSQTNESTLVLEFGPPGNYSCTASNGKGKQTKHFQVVQVKGNQTTFAAILGIFIALAVVIFVIGKIIMKPDGTFSCTK